MGPNRLCLNGNMSSKHNFFGVLRLEISVPGNLAEVFYVHLVTLSVGIGVRTYSKEGCVNIYRGSVRPSLVFMTTYSFSVVTKF